MQRPIGVVLAGGEGRRVDGHGKAGLRLGERTLLEWVAQALAQVVDEVVIAAHGDTELPGGGDGALAVWRDPPGAPRHPLTGLAAAIERASGRGVLACPVDMPFVSVAVLRALRDARDGSPVAVADGQPLLGRFGASCGPSLWAAARRGEPVRAAVAALSPTVVTVADAERVLVNVNTPADLARAERRAGASGARPPAP